MERCIVEEANNGVWLLHSLNLGLSNGPRKQRNLKLSWIKHKKPSLLLRHSLVNLKENLRDGQTRYNIKLCIA